MPLVLIERPLAFLGLLPGDSDRSSCGRVGDGFREEEFEGSSIMDRSRVGVTAFNVPKEVIGIKELGDSGEELGDGSVNDESTVEIVVVGDDSLDSECNVADEPRRCSELGRTAG